MGDMKDQMIWAEENGLCDADDAYDFVREALAAGADFQREVEKINAIDDRVIATARVIARRLTDEVREATGRDDLTVTFDTEPEGDPLRPRPSGPDRNVSGPDRTNEEEA